MPKTDRPAAVPMLARGMFGLYARYGRRPFETLISPAEQLARFGTPASRAFISDLSLVSAPLLADPNARAVFAPGGAAADRWRDDGAARSWGDAGAASGGWRRRSCTRARWPGGSRLRPPRPVAASRPPTCALRCRGCSRRSRCRPAMTRRSSCRRRPMVGWRRPWPSRRCSPTLPRSRRPGSARWPQRRAGGPGAWMPRRCWPIRRAADRCRRCRPRPPSPRSTATARRSSVP